MKKILKPIILSVVLIMLLSTLTGCQELDDMRSTHAVWTEKGVHDSITFNGVEYKRINVENAPDVFEIDARIIHVTEPDVPVLLASSKSELFDISEDENFMCGYMPYETYVADSVSDAITNNILTKAYGSSGDYWLFCKADLYDDVMKEIKDGIEYTDYGYQYTNVDGISSYYYLTDEENDAVNKIIKEVEPVQNTDYVSDYSTSVWLTPVSKSHNFSAGYNYEILWDEFDDNKYTLVTYPLVQKYGMSYEDYGTSYEVPDELTATFDKITKIAKDTQDNY